jgi:hypothetical protein
MLARGSWSLLLLSAAIGWLLVLLLILTRRS